MRLVGSFLLAVVLGCCPKPVSSTPPPSGEPSEHAPVVLEPSPLLMLVRFERESVERSWVPAERLEAEQRVDDDTSGDEDTWEPEEHDEEPAEDVRYIVVKRSRFATPESLMRHALRSAEARRPRELHEARLLLRQAGLVRVCGAERSTAIRTRVRQMFRARRNDFKRCIIAARARSSDVLAPTPAALVVEQALLRGDPMIYRFSVTLADGDDGVRVLVDDPEGRLDDLARDCIREAVPPGILGTEATRLQLPLVAFGQHSFSYGGNGLHAALAREAAILGWLHYDRGEFVEAVGYFRDAYWIFHMVEYRLLEGMAWEALGQDQRARAAYSAYVERRPKSLDTEPIKQRLEALRRSR